VSVGAEMTMDLKGPTTGDTGLLLLQLASAKAMRTSAVERRARTMGDSVGKSGSDHRAFRRRLAANPQVSRGERDERRIRTTSIIT